MLRLPTRLVLICAGLAVLAACSIPERKLPDTLFVVLPEDDGTVGAVTVDDGSSQVVLDSAYAGTGIDGRGSQRPAYLTDDQIDQVFGAALAAAPIAPRRFILYFEFGSNRLTAESQAAFEEVFADVARRVVPAIEVVGHTDTVGGGDRNAALSLERADAIKDLLIKRGTDAGLIKAYGRGERDLLTPTDDDVQEPTNRRVEITVR